MSTVHRLEIGTRAGLRDPRGESIARTVRSFLGIAVGRIRTRDVYRIDAPIGLAEVEKIRSELTDPVLQMGAIGRLHDGPFDFAITVASKPGVTDPVGKSAKVAVEDTLGRSLGDDAAVYASALYLVDGADNAQARRIALEVLANPVVQTVTIQSYDDWIATPPDLSVPRVVALAAPQVERVDLSGSDADLEALSRTRLWALTLAEMHAVRDHFRDGDPTDVEMEVIAQTWSEHCKHKIFNATITYHEPNAAPRKISSLFKSYIRATTESVDRTLRARDGRSWLVSVFHDNAGVIAFDEDVHLVYKVETHNSPSALDPYGGAITGIVGVNRDPFGTGLGAALLVNVWGYCFGPPGFKGNLPSGLLHPRRIRAGVHQGVIDGGNQSGIPYGRGWELFDNRYLGKPLVFCGTVGLLPVTIAGRPGHEKAARPGDRVVMVGGRIGADGIHGATFSSAPLDETAPVQAVQIGDPITQKRMFDFLLEARDLGLYEAITDNGAGGLSSSVGEMARAPGGATVDLTRAPLKYAGLMPWEILLSEAQERMTLAVDPEKLAALFDLARRREVEVTDLGEFTGDGFFRVVYDGKTVACLAMAFLHDGDPDLDLVARWEPPRFEEPTSPPPDDFSAVLMAMARCLNLASGEAMARHYDHEVKGLTVVKPWVGVKADVPAEGTVFLARHGSLRGFVLSESVNPFLSDLDAEAMARSVVDEAVRRQICAGARLDRIALLDNFCWPDPVTSDSNPDGAYKAAQLVRACRGLHDLAVAYGTPLISGKDSMKNDSTMGGVRISVPPTLLVSAIGLIDDVRTAVTLDFKQAGDAVFLVGATRDELGGSEYYRWLGERDGARPEPGRPAPYVGTRPPLVDERETWPIYQSLAAANGAGLVRSIATPSRGGLAFAIARAAMAGELGITADLGDAPDLAGLAVPAVLFSESNGRFVVTTAAADAGRFAAAMAGRATRIGSVTERARIDLRVFGQTVLDVDVFALKQAWKETLADV